MNEKVLVWALVFGTLPLIGSGCKSSGGGGSSGNGGVTQPSISYGGAPFTFTQGSSISAQSPINSGGAITSCAISPNLTATSGLAFDPSTCAIRGTPVMPSSTATYTISATNSGGTSTALVSIGVNSATPLVLGTAASSPNLIVANASAVYFTTNSEIYSLPTEANGTPSAFAAVAAANGDSGAYGIGLDNTYLYFTDYGPGKLQRALLASPFTLSTIATFGYSSYYAQGVAIAAGNVYWSGYTSGQVEETPIAGSSITQLFNAGSTYNTVKIATDSSNVYWTSNPNSSFNPANHGGIYQLPLSATSSTGTVTLATGLASPTSITATSGYVYWTDHLNNDVEMVSIGNTSALPTVVASSETGASSIVSDSNAIYWVDVLNASSPGLSTIRMCLLIGSGACGPASTLATVNDYVPSLALNAQALFWTEYYTSQIVQLVK